MRKTINIKDLQDKNIVAANALEPRRGCMIITADVVRGDRKEEVLSCADRYNTVSYGGIMQLNVQYLSALKECFVTLFHGLRPRLLTYSPCRGNLLFTKIQLMALLICLFTSTMKAGSIFDNLTYYGRLGYSIGGTAPLGMPETIRSLSRYTLQDNVNIGLDAYKPLQNGWGLQAGFHLENKGMETDARVKNYSMEMRQGSETLKGRFTGNVVTSVSEWMLTLPMQLSYDFNSKTRLKFGPYFSYLLSNRFDGYAYDGYLRVGDPTGDKVEMGTDEASRGDYDFSDDMRKWQFGVVIGADWFFHKRFGAFADLSWGVTGVFKKDFKTIEQTMYPIFGTIGITYRLN